MKVAVIGTGYVGLVTGTILSEIGHTVVCLDVNEEKIIKLQTGTSPIYEPGLDELLQKNIANQRLFFTTNSPEAFQHAEIIIIAVGTPQGENGAANLNHVEQAALSIAKNVDHDVIVVMKSTVPVGINDWVENFIRENKQNDIHVDVVSNPEFLREGHAIHDSFYGDRIIIGAENKTAGDAVEALYSNIEIPVLRTDRRSAEMIKYASNAFLAVKISYINQISNLCDKLGADINAVADGMGMDKRIGRQFLNAGLGYGGSCFPKDTESLVQLGRENNISLSIVESAIKANHDQRTFFINKVLEHFDGNVKGRKIAVLGLAFKPDTDDMREAPSIDIIKELADREANIFAYDPVVKYTVFLDGINLKYAASLEEAVVGAAAVLIVTEWSEFIGVDWMQLRSVLQYDVIFDGRNLLNNN
ncbi:UDP-glucose/GDP-mannose dehydrogenase family protein [Paenibacillus macerans]|uniref:UDP-glucose dehydrogenase family protein n=1 Tax=Paenibacillus macerans TaxID=44252 RepID=UPI00203BB90D|nr:UDP-glucose/GDP-mannose dehydrogenase family protein [Paenibacillus macerans]MCM3701047.1 UDP-glucose/GDP-mannose dehydrogenase family protein [Paenibacillus macerans]